MPRTAPTYDNTGSAPTFVRVSFRFIDATGDLRSVTLQVDPTDATDAKIEAMAAALGAASNANLYEIQKTDVWAAVASVGSATAGTGRSESVFDNIVIQLKSVANRSERSYIPAPIEAAFNTASDQPDGANTQLANVVLASENLLLAGGFASVGARYTERREINEQVPI